MTTAATETPAAAAVVETPAPAAAAVVETPVVETPAPDAAAVVVPPAETPAPEPGAPVVPETYELTLPDGSPLDDTARERTAATARALGLSTAAAQTVLDAVSTEVALQREALLQSHQPGGAAWTQQVDAWKAAALADTAIGKTETERTAAIQRGRQVLDRYAQQHPERAAGMRGFLDDSGLGDHPDAVRFFAWIGGAMSEGSIVVPGPAAGGTNEQDTLRKFYPSMYPTT